MFELIAANWLPLVLFMFAGFLSAYRSRLTAVLSMVFGTVAVLTALVWGWSLEQVLTGILVPCAVALFPLTGKEADL